MSCRICTGTEFRTVRAEMEKARLVSLVRVLGMEQMWVLLVEECRQRDILVAR